MQDTISLERVVSLENRLEAAPFLQLWGSLPNPVTVELPLRLPQPSAVESALQGFSYLLATRPVPGTPVQAMYLACQPANCPHLLFELKFTPNVSPLQLTVKSERPALSALVVDALQKFFV